MSQGQITANIKFNAIVAVTNAFIHLAELLVGKGKGATKQEMVAAAVTPLLESAVTVGGAAASVTSPEYAPLIQAVEPTATALVDSLAGIIYPSGLTVGDPGTVAPGTVVGTVPTVPTATAAPEPELPHDIAPVPTSASTIVTPSTPTPATPSAALVSTPPSSQSQS